jgi:NitT/TauT family transport system ATP-binding protein
MALTIERPRPISVAGETAGGIELSSVAHTYAGKTGAVAALATVNLRARRGEFVAILGPSGCGKTTLLRIVAGLLEPSSGRIRLGEDTTAEARRRRAIGWLAQNDGLLPWRNVLDNVALPLRIGRRNDRRAVLEILERVGLADSARQYPHELSGGMRQRAALARALVARPPFVLLDEPFAHLDELTRERLGELLLELRSDARLSEPPTTLLITHSVAEAVKLADRAIVLSARPGAIVLDTPIELAHPRREDEPGVGSLVRELKGALAEPRGLC